MNILKKISTYLVSFLPGSTDANQREGNENIAPIVDLTEFGLSTHQVEAALRLAHEAEEKYAGAGRGAEKNAWVTDTLRLFWSELQPHLLQILVGLGVALLKKGASSL